jgi:hypothetical protein
MPTIKKYQEQSKKAEYAYKYYLNIGYTPEQSSAIVGNLVRESGLNPSAVGDNGKAFGLAQWHPDRQAKAKQLYGEKWTDFDNQLAFVHWELNNTEKSAGDKLKKASSVWEAGKVFTDEYERPKVKFNADDKRQQHVTDVYRKYGKMELTPQDESMFRKAIFEKDVAPYMNMQSNTISILPETEINTTFATPQVEIDYLNQLETQAQAPQQTEITPQEDTFMQDLLAEISKGVEYVKPVQRDIMQSGGKIQIKDSEIEGRGVFTQDGFNKGDFIGLAHTNGQPSTKLGEFHNHSYKPNAESVLLGNDRFLVAKRKLKPNEEITVDYTKQPELEQPSDFSLYQQGGENINNENKFLAELKQLNLI